MTAREVLQPRLPNVHWEQVEAEASLVREAFRAGAMMIRLGDGELRYLRERGWLGTSLRAAVRDSTVVGLPDRYDGRPHSWRKELIQIMGGEFSQCMKVGAVLPICHPMLVGEVVRGRRALWITHKASVIGERLADPEFCDFFGFEHGRMDACLNTPAGRILPFEGMPGMILNEVCSRMDREEFEIAVVGMGLLGKLVAHYAFKELGKPAIDAGCILSTMRGQRDRVGLREGRSHSCLVWTKGKSAVDSGKAQFAMCPEGKPLPLANPQDSSEPDSEGLRADKQSKGARILIGICSATAMRERREAVRLSPCWPHNLILDEPGRQRELDRSE